MLKPVHNCALCAAGGTIPEALIWTLDIPAEPRCRTRDFKKAIE